MKLHSITSATNSLLKKIRSLHQRHFREKLKLFLIEGSKVIDEALAKQLEIEDVVVSQSYLADNPNLGWITDVESASVVEDALFEELTSTTTPQGILATAKTPMHAFGDLLGKRSGAVVQPLIVIAHGIQDPGNLGTLFRTALAASATGLVLTKGTVDPFNPKVVRSASGSLFALPFVVDMTLQQAVDEARQAGLKVIACEPKAKTNYFDVDWTSPVAVVVGNEGQGFSADELGLADELVTIPMNRQSESLNVAVSAAIVLFSAVQQRLK